MWLRNIPGGGPGCVHLELSMDTQVAPALDALRAGAAGPVPLGPCPGPGRRDPRASVLVLTFRLLPCGFPTVRCPECRRRFLCRVVPGLKDT